MIWEEHVQRGHCREEVLDLTEQKSNAKWKESEFSDDEIVGSNPDTDITFNVWIKGEKNPQP